MEQDSLLDLFNRALDLDDPAERARFLDEACGADAALRERIEALLSAHTDAGEFLSKPSQPAAGVDEAGLAEQPGDRIGRYKLLQQIGEGGCGVVYMAEQEEPVRRRVALKVIKLGMDTRQVVARFEAERQALALMDHAHIAKVLDAGATDSGRPYFVMELVSGIKITEFCDQKQLSPRERLELFMQVCSAVQHAHQKGIIHRDLKPSNILVTNVDGVAVPKVIDFGVAKATGNLRLTDKTVFTAFELLIGTPAYMSPEQVEMSGVNLDARTDVYSLGVVLYELLTGKPPFQPNDLLRDGLEEMRRTIRECQPPKPSTRISALVAEEAKPVAQARQAEILSLVKIVRGELDWIVMRCLEKDRRRRYETANEVSLDIRRHLNSEPVLARPPSRLYRFKKLLGRHSTISILSAVLLASLLAGGALLWRSERRLRHALHKTTTADRAHLHDRLLAQARDRIQSGQMGQRLEVLSALQQAAQIAPSLELRNLAGTALTRFDLREVARLPVVMSNTSRWPVAFTPDLESFVAAHSDGGFVVQSARDRTVLARLRPATGRQADSFRFSPDGRIIVADVDSQHAELWSWRDQRLLLSLAGTGRDPAIVDVHPDGQLIAGYTPSTGLFLQRLGESTRDLLDPSGPGRTCLRFSPDGFRLAATKTAGLIEVWNLTGTPARVWAQALHPLNLITPWLAWSPDGHYLLGTCEDGRGIRVFNSTNGTIENLFNGHARFAQQFEFHSDSRIVASVGQDQTLLLWDARTGQQLVSSTARRAVTRFSRDGGRLTTAVGDDEVAVLELAPPSVLREFQGSPLTASASLAVTRSSDGHLLATLSREIRLWDTQTGRELGVAHAPSTTRNAMIFDPDGSALMVRGEGNRGEGNLWRLPFILEEAAGPDRTIRWSKATKQLSDLVPTSPFALGFVRGGRDLWVVRTGMGQTNRFELWPDRKEDRARRIYADSTCGAVSADGKWVALHRGDGSGVGIYDGNTTEALTRLSTPRVDRAWFSPDSRWLLVSRRGLGYDVFSVGDWRLILSLAAKLDIPGKRGDAAISDDGRLLAVRQESDVFRLLSFPDCRELLTLIPPQDFVAQGLCFSPDGQRLWLAGQRHRVLEWDIGELRKQLANVGLGWKD